MEPLDYRGVIVIAELSLASLRPGVKIGVSGIAKGYIVDRMAAVLRGAGFKRFLVNAGDLYANGRWEVGIRDPENPSGPPICSLKVKNRAVSTSGIYERGTHIVDPRTQKTPADFTSVTVIARDSISADALATGIFVLGEKGLAGIRGLPVEGVITLNHLGEVGVAGNVSAACRGRFN